MNPAFPLLALAGLAALAVWASNRKDGGQPANKDAPATRDPIVGQPWDLTAPDPNMPAVRLPALPLDQGGTLIGWYHPVTRQLLAIAERGTKIVRGVNAGLGFPPDLPRDEEEVDYEFEPEYVGPGHS